MVETPEKIWVIGNPKHGTAVWMDTEHPQPEMSQDVSYIRSDLYAALEAQLAERVKVKPLEWVEDGRVGGHGGWVGRSGCFERVIKIGCMTAKPYEFGWDAFATFDEAKAVAQAHVDLEVLSALEASPPAPKVTEGHPMQPVVVSERGIHRFKSNKCVEALLDHGQKTGFGLNELACQAHTAEDQMQLAQLIGYSVSGYGDLSYVTAASYDLASKRSLALTAAQEAAPKVTDEIAESALDAMRSATQAAIKSEEGEGLDIQKLNLIGMRDALTAAQEAGKR